MSPPLPDDLNASTAMLAEIGCIHSDGNITKRGELFNDLPFSPRLCNFILEMVTEFNSLELAVQIASILSAPGSIYFMGGSDPKAKEAVKKAIVNDSMKIESDLMLLYNSYILWKVAGENLSNNKCCKCGFKNSNGCNRCRVMCAKENNLNNKVCDSILKSSKDVIIIFKKYQKLNVKKTNKISSSLSSSPSSLSTIEIIGRCLVGNFPEQICELLNADNPDSGAFLLESLMKGKFSSQSCLVNNNQIKLQFFVSMSIMKTTTDDIILSNNH
jgi:HrpA-like RNA helicase